MSTYFGIINKQEFSKLTKKDKADFLVAKGACQWINRIEALPNGSELFFDIDKMKSVFEPSKVTIEEFHSYVLEKYDQMIKVNFVAFFRDFNEAIFGLDTQEQKKVALNHFKEIYAQINYKNIDLFSHKKSKGLVEEVKTMNRFEKFQYMREAKMMNLCPLPIAIEYFYGNDDFFSSSDFSNQDFFKDAINFELGLKIIVSINDRFHFEDDLHFSEYGALKKLFVKYEHIFLSFEAFVWTQKTIVNMTENIPSQIDSLYSALEKEYLIYKRKSNFMTYVQDVHGIKLSKIRFFEEKTNLDHDRRVKIFRKDLEKNSLRK